MASRPFTVFPLLPLLVILLSLSSTQVIGAKKRRIFMPSESSSPFSTALETLQKQIGYTFQNIALLRRAVTHASFSEENNKALGILGANLIDASVSFHALVKDIDISSKDLNRQIAKMANVEGSCAADGLRLGLQKVVRVSSKTNSSNPILVCGAFRAIFGAIAIDTKKPDDAGSIFWKVHGGEALNL